MLFLLPGGCGARVKWVVSWPLGVLLYCTVPNCVWPRWHRWFMVTFAASTLWIAIFSYVMVWMVSPELDGRCALMTWTTQMQTHCMFS